MNEEMSKSLVDLLANIIEFVREKDESIDEVDKYILVRLLEDFRIVLKEVLEGYTEKMYYLEKIIQQARQQQQLQKNIGVDNDDIR